MVALAGCGTGGDAGEPTAATSCPAATDVAVRLPRGDAVAIAARDDRFDPPCVVVGVGRTVTLVVRNDGRHPHNLVLDAGDGSARVAVDAGQVGFVEARIGDRDVDFRCTIHPGMEGVLRVTTGG
jgi:plastocyanin